MKWLAVEMAKLKEELGKLFSLMDLGELKWLLAIAITWTAMHAPYLYVKLYILKA